ncbi:MAG TPA: M14 family metallopeptidase [Bacteroidales bacterium]|nr:M14 family metallopeptidase [Bacteroidales bacterium]
MGRELIVLDTFALLIETKGMVRRLLLLIILCGTASVISAQETDYYLIQINSDAALLRQISEMGISIDLQGADGTATLEVSADELKLLDRHHIRYKTLITNLSGYYADRNKGMNPTEVTEHFRNSKAYRVPENFSLGSMGGFCTYDEMLAHLDNMRALYPELISAREALPGFTIEGQQVFWLRISDNPDQDEPEPAVFYNSLIHSREPVSMQQMLYYMYFLLENYYSDANIQRLVDNTEMYFVPCINPDGYLHNQATNPNGGGMWRKNRRRINNKPVGVDINRNFGYKWGYDNYGSSAIHSSSTYRGESPFSEPETCIIRDFALQHSFNIVLNCHSYGNYLLQPFGYSNTANPADCDLLQHTSDRLTGWNNFTGGSTSRLLYLVNGDATDWFYADTTKQMALAYTVEIGNNLDGFWPSMARIIPLCEQMVQVNLEAARIAGSYVEAHDFSPMNLSEKNGYLKIGLNRSGLEDAPVTLSIKPLGETFASTGAAKVIPSLPLHELMIDSISYALKPGLLTGQKLQYVITIQNERFVTHDTITKYTGEAELIFYDNCDDASHWISNAWISDTLHAHSAPGSIISNSGSYYPVNQEALIVLDRNIPVAGTDALWVRFFTKWDLDGGRDFVRFIVSSDGGTSWEPLAGRYTLPAWIDGEQMPVFMNKCNKWVEVWILVPLKDTAPLQLGFLLTSDHKISKAGFWFDDFRIEALRNSEQQLITIPEGWSGISCYLYSGAPELPEFFGEHLGEVVFLEDEQDFYQPGNGNSTLSAWDSDYGYLIKTAAPFVLEVKGQTKKTGSYLLSAGWSLMPVFSDTEIAVNTIFSEPASSIVMLKEAAGTQIYWPAKGIETLQTLQPGKSYFIFLNNEATITY